jgi:hypothetical protein
METYKIKNYILAFIKQSQTFKNNGNADSLIDENLQEINYLNKGIVSIIEAIKATKATKIALEKAFGFLNGAFIDMQNLENQIEICENEKKLAEKEATKRHELDSFLATLSPEMALSEIINNQ